MMHKKERNRKKKERKFFGLYFLGFVITLYAILYVFYPENTYNSLEASGRIFVTIFPVLIVIVFLMGLLNYFLKPKRISRYLGEEAGMKSWLIAISAGVLSHGPIFVWYPLLRDLHDRGMRASLVAVFLYNRAIKIPLLPIMVYYFGISFVVILMAYMVIASIVEGKIIEVMEHDE